MLAGVLRTRQAQVIAVLAFLATPLSALAHGAQCAVAQDGTVVTATYSDGTPMAFCDAAVFAPDDAEQPYQTGSTDRNGCFAFRPDTNGTWKVTIDDGMGHRAAAEVVLNTGSVTVSGPPRAVLAGPVIGVCLILGIFGVLAMSLSLKRSKSKRV